MFTKVGSNTVVNFIYISHMNERDFTIQQSIIEFGKHVCCFVWKQRCLGGACSLRRVLWLLNVFFPVPYVAADLY